MGEVGAAGYTNATRELVTEEIPLDRINDALELMKEDKGYRYVVRY